MQINVLRLVVGTLSAFAACSAIAQIKWVPSYGAAKKEAGASNKLVMVEFYASWDIDPNPQPRVPTPGQRLERETFEDPAAQAVANKFVPVRVDVEKEGATLAKKFHITNYPTVLFLDKSEKSVGLIDGYETSDEFVKHGNTFLKDYKDLPGFEAKYKANKKDLDAITHIGVIFADRYEIGPALAKLAEAEKIDAANKTDKLSDLFNAIADYYQNASEFEPAIKYFDKTANTSKVTDKRAYGYLSIVACCFSLAQLDGVDHEIPITPDQGRAFLKRAIPYLDACGKLHLKEDDQKILEQDRTVIRTVFGSGGGL